MDTKKSKVMKFYEGRSVFITGATGFIGKVLLEKLLRSCTGLKKVYILMREKRNKDPEQRLTDLLSCQVFDSLKETKPGVLNKIVCVTGDVSLPQFGISEKQMTEIIDNVSVVFHSAATVKYEEPLKKAVEMNVIAVRTMLEICRKIKNLQALVHVSTAFCNCYLTDIEEKVLPTKFAPQHIIDMAKWMPTEVIDEVTPKLLEDRPNTYIFTKALAENLVINEYGSLPVSIIRPSTVSAAWKEPYAGWVDSMNGPAGIGVVGGKGVLRAMVVDDSKHPDIVPVDIVANLMIVVGWYTAQKRSDDVKVFNCTNTNPKSMSWKEILDTTYPMYMDSPSSELYWYPASGFQRNRTVSRTYEVLFHYLPALMIDFLAYITFQKPGMLKLYQKIHKITHGYEFFTTSEWHYETKNVLELIEQMQDEDKQVFYCDGRSINWNEYWRNHVYGCRKYLLKEDPKTIPAARKKMQRLYIVSRVGYVIFAYGACRLVIGNLLPKLYDITMSLAEKLRLDGHIPCYES